MATNEQIAKDVLVAVGGKGNVISATHCMSRLRLNLKDETLAPDDGIKAVEGVINVAHVGPQMQVIIGPNVANVYKAFVAEAGLDEEEQIEENLDAPKQKLTPKAIGLAALDYLTGSMGPLLSVFMCAGLFKTIQVILGPTLLGVITPEQDLYILSDIVFKGVFYFLPIYLGYSAARKLKANPALGILLAAVLVVPNFTQIADAGGTFSVYGIPAPTISYAQSVLPILLSVWAMSYVERFFNKVVPVMLQTVFAPFLTMVVMLPIEFCLFGPLGYWCGEALSGVFVAAGNAGGIVSVLALGTLTAIQPLLVATGMSKVFSAIAITTLTTQGVEPFLLVANVISNFGVWAVGLAMAARLKDKDSKATGLNCFVSGAVGGLSEPALYGICLSRPRTFIGVIAGGAVAGIICGLASVKYYALGATSVLRLLSFISPNQANVIFAAVAAVAGFIVSFAVNYFFGFSKKEIEESVAKAKAE